MGQGVEGARWSEGRGVEGVWWSEGRGIEGAWWSGVGAKSRVSGGREPGAGASGIWGRGVEGGDGVEGGGDTELGQSDGVKPNFTVIRILCRWGYSPYTRYYWYQLT
jgi:hypothetical protein